MHAPSREWNAYGGAPDQSRYSSLDQINRTNVQSLRVARTFDTGETGGLQTQPIVVRLNATYLDPDGYPAVRADEPIITPPSTDTARGGGHPRSRPSQTLRTSPSAARKGSDPGLTPSPFLPRRAASVRAASAYSCPRRRQRPQEVRLVWPLRGLCVVVSRAWSKPVRTSEPAARDRKGSDPGLTPSQFLHPSRPVGSRNKCVRAGCRLLVTCFQIRPIPIPDPRSPIPDPRSPIPDPRSPIPT
jgi:hypothetical protein